MSRLKFLIIPLAALAGLTSLTGCVAYPAYGDGYYGSPGATVVVPGPVYRPYYGGYYRGGWGHGRYR
jgi:hypothetical protein